jgi:hypothetical protein
MRHLVGAHSTGQQIDAITAATQAPGSSVPSALASDSQGRLAVIERGSARLQLLRLAGKDPE